MSYFLLKNIMAQSENKMLYTGLELSSARAWRGLILNNGIHINPNISYKLNKNIDILFTSYLSNDYNEIDLHFSYKLNNIKASIIDHFPGNGIYYNRFGNSITEHSIETEIVYKLKKPIPINLLASVIVYGNDKVLDSIDIRNNWTPRYFDKNNFSTYLEASYSYKSSSYTFLFKAGTVPFKSFYYRASSLALVHLSVSLVKEIKLTEDYSLPVNYQIMYNPNLEQIYFTIYLTLIDSK